MIRLPDYDPPEYRRSFADYDLQQDIAAQIRVEMITNSVSRRLSSTARSRPALRTFGLAFLIATGAFWMVMLKDPPQTVAADPNAVSQALSPPTTPARIR